MRMQASINLMGMFKRLVRRSCSPVPNEIPKMEVVLTAQKKRSVDELSEDRKIELLALTKVVGSWQELLAEYRYRGYEVVHVGDRLFLGVLQPVREVICEMSELGFGTTMRDLCRRFGELPSQV